MTKSKAQLDAVIVSLRSAWESARQAATREPTAENRDLAKAAWAALVDATPRMKTGGFASRAGKRQAAERRALAAARRGRSHSTIKKTPAELDAEIAEVLRAKKWQEQVAREEQERRARITPVAGPSSAQLYDERASDVAAGVHHGEQRGRARSFRRTPRYR